MTVYIFDKDKRLRTPLDTGESVDLIHDENNRTITISIAAVHQVKTGEYVGFRCMDNHFRLFCVTIAALDDDKRCIDVTATDAIVQEMQEAIIEEKQQIDVTLGDALSGLVPDDTWQVIGTEPDRLEKSRAYYTSLWTMLTTLEQLYEWKVDAYYTFEGGEIVSKVLEMREDVPIFRGRILQSGKDASKVYVTSTGRPYTRLYGLGPATGSQDEPKNLTFADAVWSTANGDPVDKPKGQAWVEDPEAVEEHGLHTTTVNIQDAEDADDLLQKTWDELQKRKQATVSIKATVADMELVPGYSYMQIRLGDLVAVCLKDGTIVEAKIVAIKRHYHKPWLTTITIGEKAASIQTQVSSLITSANHTFERLTIYKNRFEEDEALIQMNAEHIQLNATTIIEHAEQILLKAEQEDLEAVQLLIDGINDEIVAMAGRIALNADAIALNAENIDLLSDEIVLQSQQISAKADLILLEGYVKAEDLETEVLTVVDSAYILGLLSGEMIDAQSLVAASVNTEYMSADSITTDGLRVDGFDFTSHSHAVTVDGGTVTLGEVSSSGGSFNIADTQFYKDGVSAAFESVTLSSAGWVGGSNVVSASNGKSLTIALPTFKTSGGETFTDKKTTVYFYTDSVSSPLQSVVVDASTVYDEGYAAGYQAAKDAVEVSAGITWSNPAQYYAMVRYWAAATIDGEQVAYTSASESKNISGYV